MTKQTIDNDTALDMVMDNDADQAPTSIPEILPNGAMIIKIYQGENGGVVLAETNKGEYATWEFPKGNLAGTYWGHYFTVLGLDDAIADFRTRLLKHI